MGYLVRSGQINLQNYLISETDCADALPNIEFSFSLNLRILNSYLDNKAKIIFPLLLLSPLPQRNPFPRLL